MKASTILRRAKKLIQQEHNWGKGRRGADRPLFTFCAAEAVENSAPLMDGVTRTEAFDHICDAAGISRKFGSIPDWNDNPKTTHKDILRAFSAAIKSAAGERR